MSELFIQGGKMIKLLVSCLLSSLIFHATQASDTTDSSWDQLLKTAKLPSNEQSYCFSNSLQKIEGENLDLRVRLASVSKLMTSLWAIETLGAQYKFETKLFIQGNNLHISGSFDPFLGNEKMFFLLSQLNDLGYTKFDTITYDKNLLINPLAQTPADQYPLITRETNAKNLKIYFNTNSWSAAMKAEYDRIASISPNGKIRKSVRFEIGDAKYVEKNPLDINTARMLTLSSPPLYKYLKETNVQSNNYAAHTLFLKLGGESRFEKYIAAQFGYTSEVIHFFTGSGLPTTINGKRSDNYATCAVVLELISSLKDSIEKSGLDLKNIMAVPGSDGGTFSTRIFPAEYKNSFVAKTGTLVHTSTLAGAMNTRKGFNFYGIFNQSTDIEGSKLVQNEMIKTLMTEMGGPLAFNYVVIPFQTYGSDVALIDSQPSNFAPYEENLF